MECEHCKKSLPNGSDEARICSFECTFCEDCVAKFQGVCPNCKGNFTHRPKRPENLLEKYPIGMKPV